MQLGCAGAQRRGCALRHAPRAAPLTISDKTKGCGQHFNDIHLHILDLSKEGARRVHACRSAACVCRVGRRERGRGWYPEGVGSRALGAGRREQGTGRRAGGKASCAHVCVQEHAILQYRNAAHTAAMQLTHDRHPEWAPCLGRARRRGQRPRARL